MDKINKIAAIIEGTDLVSLREKLETIFKEKDIKFSFSPIPHYQIKTGGETIVICNTKYADEAEITIKNIAIGYLDKI